MPKPNKMMPPKAANVDSGFAAALAPGAPKRPPVKTGSASPTTRPMPIRPGTPSGSTPTPPRVNGTIKNLPNVRPGIVKKFLKKYGQESQ